MANTRIKDISTAASTLNSDDFIAVDGNTAGTRKMAKADLITEVSTGVSGTYLEESNNLSDVASKDTSKLNLEVPDVGTGPQEVPLNSMLSGMAYMSPDSVAVGTLEITDKVDGSLGIGVTPDKPLHVGGSGEQTLRLENTDTALGDGDVVGSVEFEANDASGNGSGVVSKIQSESLNATGNLFGLSFHTGHGGSLTEKMVLDNDGKVGIGCSPTATLELTDATSNVAAVRVTRRSDLASTYLEMGTTGGSGEVRSTDNLVLSSDPNNDGGSSKIELKVDGTTRVKITNSGNLHIANGNLGFDTSGKGIDFGAVATSAGDGTGTTGTVSNQVFSDYEFGSWVPTFATTGVDFTTMTVEVVAAQYVKVGRVVHCQAYLRTDNVDATGASGTVVVDGLPFVSDTTADNFSTLNVGYSASWVNAPAAGYLQPNAAYVRLTRYSTTGASTITPSDLTAGASADKNTLIFSLSYIAST